MSDYKILKDLSKFNTYTKSQRFNSWKIENSDGIFYRKEGLSAETKLSLKNEVAFCNYLNSLESNVRAPKVISFDHNIALFEWIEAPLLVKEGEIDKLNDEQISRLADVIHFMSGLNGLGQDWLVPEVTSENLLEKINNWSQQPLLHGLLNEEELSRAMSVIKEHLVLTETTFQHGDLIGSHIFNSNKLIVYDGEHASDMHPKFYDFARSYIHAFTTTKDKQSVESLVVEVAKRFETSTEKLFEEAVVALLSRSIGRLNDSINQLDTIDYREDARTLFVALLNGEFPNSIKI